MSYVYIESEKGVWTVGFYSPEDNKWHPESDHDSRDAAAKRVMRLNGGSDQVEDANVRRMGGD